MTVMIVMMNAIVTMSMVTIVDVVFGLAPFGVPSHFYKEIYLWQDNWLVG